MSGSVGLGPNDMEIGALLAAGAGEGLANPFWFLYLSTLSL